MSNSIVPVISGTVTGPWPAGQTCHSTSNLELLLDLITSRMLDTARLQYLSNRPNHSIESHQRYASACSGRP